MNYYSAAKKYDIIKLADKLLQVDKNKNKKHETVLTG